MNSKKALIITYYWPPSGGPGVQRWLKFTKYLRTFGWEPVIYTAENPEAPVTDLSLERDIPENLTVIRRKILEPYTLYKIFTRKGVKSAIGSSMLSESQKPNTSERISRWIRGNFFIPDARKFWIRPSVRYLSQWLEENPVDVIISTGPPHSMHMIALGLKEKAGLPWLADFRDPWTNIDYYDDLFIGKRADRKHRRLEAEVIAKADRVVTVSPTWENEFERVHSRPVDLITNGYDEEDFKGVNPAPDPYFSLSHFGTLMANRNPFTLWEVLSDLIHTSEDFSQDFRLILAGHIDISVTDALRNAGLSDHVITTGYLPHNEVIKRQKSTAVLLDVMKNSRGVEGLYAGKLFEYLAARRPVLLIGPDDSDAAKLIRQTGAGHAVGYNRSDELKRVILELYENYRKGTLTCESRSIERFSRRDLTGKLAAILADMTDNKAAEI